MNEREQIHAIVTAAYSLMKSLGFEALSDEQWAEFLERHFEVTSPKAEKLSGAEYNFAMAVCMAIDNYYREKGQLQEYAKKD
ncbi:MAG: hypothetical protein HUJ98_05150 [Bacteroidaceae bacterium]|nr:hypothetical protein [Bacteroidaceae bacterium]